MGHPDTIVLHVCYADDRRGVVQRVDRGHGNCETRSNMSQANMSHIHDLAFGQLPHELDQAGVSISPSDEARSREASAKPSNRRVRQFSLTAMFVKPLVRLARRFGFYVTRDPNWLVYEDHIVRVLSKFKINCVLDVGSYRGEFAKWLRTIGYAGLIISFEAVSANFDVLEESRAEDPDWHAHRMALGATKGTAAIRVFAGSTFHSFLAPSDYGRERFPDKLQLERTESVQVERLDNILDRLVDGIDDPHIFLKVDTQGYDLEVIRGLGTKAKSISAMQVEIAVKPIYDQMTNSFVDALGQLQHMGFQISGMFPVSHSDDHMQVVEFDCVMCRPEHGAATSVSET